MLQNFCCDLFSQIKFANRFLDTEAEPLSLSADGPFTTVDGVDCEMQESYPFSSMWHSHKSNGSALRYEVAWATRSNNIVWANGPFPAGTCPDGKICRQCGFTDSLEPDETFLADLGYVGIPQCINKSTAD